MKTKYALFIVVIVLVAIAGGYALGHHSKPISSPNTVNATSAINSDFISSLPMGDVTTTQCNDLISKENDHANAVYVASGSPNTFIETISASKYLYSKKLCLALMERVSIYPGDTDTTTDTWIEDMSSGDIFSEIAIRPVKTNDVTVWYQGKETTDYSKTPTTLWNDVEQAQ